MGQRVRAAGRGEEARSRGQSVRKDSDTECTAHRGKEGKLGGTSQLLQCLEMAKPRVGHLFLLQLSPGLRG